MMRRPRFWHALFRRQPVELGAADPISVERELTSLRLQAASTDLHRALDQFARRLRAREQGDGAPAPH